MTFRNGESSALACLYYGFSDIFPFRMSWPYGDSTFTVKVVGAPTSVIRPIVRYGAGIAIILVITCLFRLGMQVNATTAGFTFLLAILSGSAVWGLGVSAMMSVAATAAFDYFFLPPVGSMDIADPQDWMALSAFLITAVLGSSLSARAQNRAMEAERQRQELQRLYELSQRLLSEASLMELSRAIPQRILESFKADSVAMYLTGTQETHRAGSAEPHLADNHLRIAAEGLEVQEKGHGNNFFAPLRSGSTLIGSLGISGPGISQGTIDALGFLIAAAVERAGAIERAAKMDATRESEELKSIMLDAIAHDFRTPLTGIKTSVSALLTDVEFNREQERELLAIIDEECDRIDHLMDKASEVVRLQSGEVKLNLKSHSLDELISRALADCKAVSLMRRIDCEINHRELQVLADLPWASSVLVQLIVNAHLYSSPGLPIAVHSFESDGFAMIRVSDHGPGIKKSEAGRIFEKYYRCSDKESYVHGTGMGLPIAKAIVEAHGGKIDVVSRDGWGSAFTFSLPLERLVAMSSSLGPG